MRPHPRFLPRPALASVSVSLAVTLALSLGLRARVSVASALDDALATRCTPDPRLSDSARAALQPTDRLDAVALRALAERSGLAAPSVHAVVVRGATEPSRAEAVAHWLDTQRVAPTARCAVAVQGDLASVVLVPRSADVAPLDPNATPGSTRDYAFGLPPDVRSPSLVVTLPSGEVTILPVATDGPTHVAFTQPGPYALQLVVATDNGPAPMATWHVQSGPTAPLVTPGRAVSAPRDVLAAVNALRTRAGLSPLRADPLLAHVAETYAQRLAARAEVSHGASPGDSPVARMADAHLTASRVAENVARAPTLAAAHARLLASPSHRANLLDGVVDAAGVGVATAGRDVYLVELLATHPALRSD